MSTPTSCPDEGTLRAYLDTALPAAEQARVERHVRDCPACAEAVNVLRGRMELVYTALSRLPGRRPATGAAWQRFRAGNQPRSGNLPLRWRIETMWDSLRFRFGRPALAGAILVVLLVSVLTVAPLRAAAARFLSIFRVQQFAVVQIDPADLERLEDFDQELFSEPEMDEVEPVEVGSADEASQQVGFQVLTPGYIPAGAEASPKILVAGARTARSEVDVAAARRLLEATGLPTDALPEGVERLPVTASILPSVMLEIGEGAQKIHIVQGPSPEVDVPEGLDLQRLGEVGLQLLGLSAEEAARLSGSIDWGTTLVVPVPTDVGDVQEIAVRGNNGYLIQDSDRGDAVLFWEADGLLYAVSGRVDSSELLQVAESLQ